MTIDSSTVGPPSTRGPLIPELGFKFRSGDVVRVHFVQPGERGDLTIYGASLFGIFGRGASGKDIFIPWGSISLIQHLDAIMALASAPGLEGME